MREEKIVYFNYCYGVDPTLVNKFIQFCENAIVEHNPTHLYFFISSNGGTVESGFILYNYIISLKPELQIIMHNVGSIDSIANLVFMSGDKRYASPNSTFLLHGVVYNVNGLYTLSQIREQESLIAEMENKIIGTFCKNSKLKSKDIKELFLKGKCVNDSFALEKGIVHEIKIPVKPLGSIYLLMNF